MPRQALVDERIVRVQQVRQAAILAQGAADKQLRLPLECLQQTLVVIGITVRIDNNFADAAPISGPSGTVTGSTVGASNEPGEPSDPAMLSNASIWYVWTAPASADFTFDTCGSDFDTVLAVYTGKTLSALTPVASNDNGCAIDSSQSSSGKARSRSGIGR